MLKERRNRPAIVNIAGLFLHPLLREGAMHACAATRGSGQQSDNASDGGNTGPPRWHRVMTSQARPPFSRPSGIEKAPLEIPKGASPSYRCAFSRKMDQLPLSYRLRRANQIPRPATATPAIATPTVGTREVPVEGSFPPPTGPSGTWGEPGSPGSSGLS